MTNKSPFDPKHWPKVEGLPDLLATQQRSFEAMTKAGQILGEAMRQCAERQMQAAKSAFDQLVTTAPVPPTSVTPDASWQDHSLRLQGQIEQLAAHISSLNEIMVDAHKAALEELRAAWTMAGGTETGVYPASPPKPVPPAPPAPSMRPTPAPAEPAVTVANSDKVAAPKPQPAAQAKATEPDAAPVPPAQPPKPAAKRAAPRATNKPTTKS